MKVKTVEEAWIKANEIFPYDYTKDDDSSVKAGYSIYRSTANEHPENWISDLGDRLEVNLENGKSENIWIESEEFHHYEVLIFGKSHNFEFVCSTIYEALDAIVDAGCSFGFDVGTTELMLSLADMEKGIIDSFSAHKYSVGRKDGEI